MLSKEVFGRAVGFLIQHRRGVSGFDDFLSAWKSANNFLAENLVPKPNYYRRRRESSTFG